MSRNKREGFYGGQWKEKHGVYQGVDGQWYVAHREPRKHHRIKHHTKPPGLKSVGQPLLLAIF